jgi:prolipoprotein diacylglyceryltransferase
MKLAVKYGLMVTAGVIVWVVVAHLLVRDPASPVHTGGAAVFFNLLEIVGLTLGIREKQHEVGILSFKQGIKTGVAVAVVYGITVSLFFVFVSVFFPEVLAAKRQTPDQPLWQAALMAFAGLFIGAVLFGLIYSTIISFFVVRAQKARRYD